MTFGLTPTRAAASRRNGAKSRGPRTADGKARSAQNALRHGLRAQKYVVLPDEDAAEFAALEAALMDELAPAGVLQGVLAQRIVAATWRLSRAERLEVELFAENGLPGRSLGLALIRDGNRARAFDTLVRYRGGALAEFWRALRTLKALQAEAAPHAGDALPRPATEASAPAAQPNKPKRRRIPGESGAAPSIGQPDPEPAGTPDAAEPLPFRSVSLPNQPGPGSAQRAEPAPGAIAPPRDRSGSWAQPSRSTP